jgi:hypothetical protein
MYKFQSLRVLGTLRKKGLARLFWARLFGRTTQSFAEFGPQGVAGKDDSLFF